MICNISLFSDIHNRRQTIVATSGGFDPVHIGHVRCIKGSKSYGDILVVIVNGDGFLKRKKGFVFMSLDERMEIIDSIKGVDYVIPWDDGTQFVHGALQLIKPDVFTKGGDRSAPEYIAKEELDICKEIGCTIKYGVGGSIKVQSSSRLVHDYR